MTCRSPAALVSVDYCRDFGVSIKVDSALLELFPKRFCTGEHLAVKTVQSPRLHVVGYVIGVETFSRLALNRIQQ